MKTNLKSRDSIIYPFIIFQGPYAKPIKGVEDDIQKGMKRVNELTGIKESDTGLAHPAMWDLAADKQVHLQNSLTKVLTTKSDSRNFQLFFQTYEKV